MEEVPLQRPWSAEVATPVDGSKPKYNLKEANSEGWMATVMATQKAGPAKSPSTKKLKEQWAKELVSTVDYVRENGQSPEIVIVHEKVELVQVCRLALSSALACRC